MSIGWRIAGVVAGLVALYGAWKGFEYWVQKPVLERLAKVEQQREDAIERLGQLEDGLVETSALAHQHMRNMSELQKELDRIRGSLTLSETEDANAAVDAFQEGRVRRLRKWSEQDG